MEKRLNLWQILLPWLLGGGCVGGKGEYFTFAFLWALSLLNSFSPFYFFFPCLTRCVTSLHIIWIVKYTEINYHICLWIGLVLTGVISIRVKISYRERAFILSRTKHSAPPQRDVLNQHCFAELISFTGYRR